MPAAMVIDRVSNFWSGHKCGSTKSQILVLNVVMVLRSGLHTPIQLRLSTFNVYTMYIVELVRCTDRKEDTLAGAARLFLQFLSDLKNSQVLKCS